MRARSETFAIDPGAAGRGNAVAWFSGESLASTWFAFASTVDDLCPDVVVIEKPEYQGDRTASARPQDLINLAWSGAMLAGVYVGRGASLIEYTPTQWKGPVPKPVHHKRLWAALNDDERKLLGGERTYARIEQACRKGAATRWGRPGASYYPRTWDMHNILDAVALGCFELGRMKKG